MPFEDEIREVLTPAPPAAAIRWRRCVRCGSVSYAAPLVTCRVRLDAVKLAGGQVVPGATECGGQLSRPPGWRTMVCPHSGDGRSLLLEYCQ